MKERRDSTISTRRRTLDLSSSSLNQSAYYKQSEGIFEMDYLGECLGFYSADSCVPVVVTCSIKVVYLSVSSTPTERDHRRRRAFYFSLNIIKKTSLFS